MPEFFIPPEARDRRRVASPLRLRCARACTPERLTLATLLAVTLPVTAGLAPVYPEVIVPSTALVACTFWYLARRVTRRGALIAYCFAAGLLGGVLNGWLSVVLVSLFYPGDMFIRFDADTVGIASVVGALVGLAYGIAYLLPMLVQLSARSLRRTEAIDRSLIGFGAWGTCVMLGGLAVAYAYSGSAPMRFSLDPLLIVLQGSAAVHAALFGGGMLRAARRRWWLTRVVQGKVPGWLVCDQQRFYSAELAELELFCQPLRRKYSEDLRVLARSETTATGEAYRSVSIVPKFFIA